MSNVLGSLMIVPEDVFAIVLQPGCERAIAPIVPAAVTLRNSLLDCLLFMVVFYEGVNYLLMKNELKII
jgi:hypothetical protein